MDKRTARSDHAPRRATASFTDELVNRLGPPPETPAALHEWIRTHLDVSIPSRAILGGSDAPLAYLVHSFFEGTGGRAAQGSAPGDNRPSTSVGGSDCVVWANRGGGKTFLGAIATVLDLVYKPGIQVRILGGSLEQSQRMLRYLRSFFERENLAWGTDGRLGITDKRVRLWNDSCAEVLAASQTSVRGTRVQKVRCDEVDLFDRDVWEAAQLTTRSIACEGPWGGIVRGSIEALSTMHRPMGVMWDVVAGASRVDSTQHATNSTQHTAHTTHWEGGATRVLFRWGVVDSLAVCDDERPCGPCPLLGECGGRAKAGVARSAADAGHISIDDAITMKARVGDEVWKSEMLCLRPRRSDTVFPEFDAAVHVFDDGLPPAPPPDGTRLLCGMDFGYRGETVILFCFRSPDGVLRIMGEIAQTGQRLEQHIRAILDSPWGVPDWIGADPAARQVNYHTGLCTVGAMRAAGLAVRWRGSEILDGVDLVRARLRLAAGPPSLFVHARCERMIDSLHRHRFDPDRRDSLKPLKDGTDHAADALRYLVLNLDRPWREAGGNYVDRRWAA